MVPMGPVLGEALLIVAAAECCVARMDHDPRVYGHVAAFALRLFEQGHCKIPEQPLVLVGLFPGKQWLVVNVVGSTVLDNSSLFAQGTEVIHLPTSHACPIPFLHSHQLLVLSNFYFCPFDGYEMDLTVVSAQISKVTSKIY